MCPNLAESALNELKKYIRMNKINTNDGPHASWKANKSNLPILATLSRVYLCPSASSSDSEREFNILKLIQKYRIQFLPKNVEVLLFLKYNPRVVLYSTALPECYTPPN